MARIEDPWTEFVAEQAKIEAELRKAMAPSPEWSKALTEEKRLMAIRAEAAEKLRPPEIESVLQKLHKQQDKMRLALDRLKTPAPEPALRKLIEHEQAIRRTIERAVQPLSDIARRSQNIVNAVERMTATTWQAAAAAQKSPVLKVAVATARKAVAHQAAVTAVKKAAERAKQVHSWIDLHNRVFGIGGLATEQFPSESERVAFAKTDEFQRVLNVIDETRDSEEDLEDPERKRLAKLMASANGKLSVRVPRAIHAALLAEAEAEGVSLNQLCLAKLCVQLRSTV